MSSLLPLIQRFGLTKNEAKIYISLLTLKEAKASEIAKATNIPRNKIYEIVENLSKKGFVEILPEKVLSFRALPFESAFDYYVQRYQRRIKSLHESKDKINDYLKKLVIRKEEEHGYFAVLRSKSIIYKKIEDMLENSKKDAILMINSPDIRRLTYIAKNSSRTIRIKVLFPITNDNKQLAKKWLSFTELRHYEAQNNVKTVIVDDSEILVFQTNMPTGLYSNDPQFIALLKSFIGSTWEHSPSGRDKIEELETGKPLEEVRHIRGRENIYKELEPIYNNTQKDIILMTTSHGVIRVYKYLRDLVSAVTKRGVRFRILTHINKSNIDYVKKLSSMGIEIRHVDKIYAVASCYDDSVMQMMRVRNDNTTLKSDDVSIITNQTHTVKMIRQLLEEMWTHGIDVAQMEENIEKGKPIKEMRVISGKENIYQLLREITAQAKKEVCMIATEKSLERAIKHEYFDIDSRLSKKIKIRYLMPVTPSNIDLVKKAMRFAEIRHIDFTPMRIRIIDSERCTTRYGGEEMGYLEEGMCVFSNIKGYISTMKEYFEKTWAEAIPAANKIKEIETGKPVEEMEIIYGKENIWKVFRDMTSHAKKEVCVLSTEKVVQRAIDSGLFGMQRKLSKKKVKIRYIVPITKENRDQVKKLMTIAEVRHIDFTPIAIRLVDGEKCTLRHGGEDFSFTQEMTVYSNIKNYVRTTRDYYENAWQNAIPAEERIQELETGEPREEVRYLRGREELYRVLPGVVKAVKDDIIWMLPENGLIRLCSNIKDALTEAKKRGVRMRCLTQITKNNMRIAREAKAIGIEVRHVNKIYSNAGCYGDNTLLMLHTKKDDTSIVSPSDILIYSTQKNTVNMMRRMLEDSWKKSVSLEDKIKEIKTGKPIEEIKIISGLDNALKVVNEITPHAKKEVCHMATEWTFERLLKGNIFDIEKKLAKRIKFRYVVPITKNNIEHIKKVMQYAEVRHADIVPLRMRIKDDTECIMRYGGEEKVIDTIYVHSTIRDHVRTVKNYFEKSWEEAMPAEEKIDEIEKGIVPEQVKYMRDRENLYSLAPKLILGARKDILFMATDKGILRMYKHIKKYIDKAAEKGVRIRCITHISEKNKRIIKDFSSMEIRHVDKIYSIADCYDDSAVTILQTKNDTEDTESPNDVIIYSTQRNTVKMMRHMMEEVWRSGLPSFERVNQLQEGIMKVVRVKTKVSKEGVETKDATKEVFVSEVPAKKLTRKRKESE